MLVCLSGRGDKDVDQAMELLESLMALMEKHFRAARDAGRKLLVPYVTGGYPGWEDAIRAAAAAGADGVEIGIPFSDPVMDGPVIQQASQAALDAGVTPPAILDAAAGLDVGIPLAVMTYYNLVHHDGHRRFAGRLVAAGIDACILPDLPLEEAGPWCDAADDGRRGDGHARRADGARRATSADRRSGRGGSSTPSGCSV